MTRTKQTAPEKVKGAPAWNWKSIPLKVGKATLSVASREEVRPRYAPLWLAGTNFEYREVKLVVSAAFPIEIPEIETKKTAISEDVANKKEKRATTNPRTGSAVWFDSLFLVWFGLFSKI